MLFFSCACVSVSGVLFSVGVCVCALLIFSQMNTGRGRAPFRYVFVWGFGVLFLLCACVSVSGVLFSVGVCVCALLIFLQDAATNGAPCANAGSGLGLTL